MRGVLGGDARESADAPVSDDRSGGARGRQRLPRQSPEACLRGHWTLTWSTVRRASSRRAAIAAHCNARREHTEKSVGHRTSLISIIASRQPRNLHALYRRAIQTGLRIPVTRSANNSDAT